MSPTEKSKDTFEHSEDGGRGDDNQEAEEHVEGSQLPVKITIDDKSNEDDEEEVGSSCRTLRRTQELMNQPAPTSTQNKEGKRSRSRSDSVTASASASASPSNGEEAEDAETQAAPSKKQKKAIDEKKVKARAVTASNKKASSCFARDRMPANALATQDPFFNRERGRQDQSRRRLRIGDQNAQSQTYTQSQTRSSRSYDSQETFLHRR